MINTQKNVKEMVDAALTGNSDSETLGQLQRDLGELRNAVRAQQLRVAEAVEAAQIRENAQKQLSSMSDKEKEALRQELNLPEPPESTTKTHGF